MIFVNNPGDWGHLSWPFEHAEWHGWTPTDLIFPFFLFIVGVAGALSLEKRAAAGASGAELARHAFRRGMTIALVGWLLAWFPFTLERLSRLRIPGVLPRIGVVFVLGTWIVLACGRRRWVVLAATLLLLALHTLLATGLGYDLTREGNLQRALDLALLKGHLWKKDWDPEGILSTLTSVATMLTGTLTGWWLTSARPLGERLRTLAAAGALTALAGQLLHPLLPINKNLWTASYVLLTSGLAALTLAFCLYLCDVKSWRLSFFTTFGTNPLLAFVLSGLLAKLLGLVKWTAAGGKLVSLHAFLYRAAFSWLPQRTLASHAWALLEVLLFWGILRVFEKRGWFWKV